MRRRGPALRRPRSTRVAILSLLAVAALPAAALIAIPAATSGAADPGQVVARDGAGRVVASLPLDRSGRFALAYRHSVERAAGEERFAARPHGGGFELRALASGDAGVLDYYEATGHRTRQGGGWVQRLARPVPYTALRLAASAHGRRTLVAQGRRAALHPRGGVAHVTIRVEGR